MLKQHRDNFQFGGKDKLNLRLAGCLPQPASFFTDLEVFNPVIKSVKNIWNLKRVWITSKSLSDFYCQVFAFVRNDIFSYNRPMALFFILTCDNSFRQVNFFAISIHL